MGDPFANRPFPRAPLIGAAVLVFMSLAAAAGGRLIGLGEAAVSGEAVTVRDLRFQDRSDGGIDVIDAGVGQTIDVVVPGSNGFLRATLRGLARERKRQEIGQEIPFRLTGWADGRLTLQDSATGRLVDFGAFGHTNAEVFARLLTLNGPAR